MLTYQRENLRLSRRPQPAPGALQSVDRLVRVMAPPRRMPRCESAGVLRAFFGTLQRGWRTPREPPQRSTDRPGRCLGQASGRGNPIGLALGGWFGELSVLIKRRHPEVQAKIDRVYQDLAKLGKRQRDPPAQDD